MRAPSPPSPDSVAWTVDDVAGFLGKSKAWVYEEVKARRLPFFRIGGSLRFRESEIRDWAEKRREGVA